MVVVVVLLAIVTFVIPKLSFSVDARPATYKDIGYFVYGILPKDVRSNIEIFFPPKKATPITPTGSNADTPSNNQDATQNVAQSGSDQIPVPTAAPIDIVKQDDAYYDSLVAMYTDTSTPEITKQVLKNFLRFRNETFPNWNTFSWSYSKDYIYGYIVNTNPVDKKVNLYIQTPSAQDFSSKYEHTSSVYCDETNTILLATNLDVIKAGVNFWDTVKPKGYNIFTYCKDSECNAIGDACIIIDTTPLPEESQ